MKQFPTKNLKEAKEYAASGNLALVVPEHVCNQPDCPRCFKGKRYGYLLCGDKQLLENTARKLGVRIIKIDRTDSPGQHINLCGKPLEKAVLAAKVWAILQLDKKVFE